MKKGRNLRCYEDHKDLELIDGLKITGGSCNLPLLGYDVYIGFDHGMWNDETSYPWTEGVSFLFEIKDGHAPKNPKNFEKLIDWTIEQLKAGKTVHCGCIGGHGRTGTFLAALYTKMTGEKDSIKHIREVYCERAVESDEQITFLHKNYGIIKQEGSRRSVDLRRSGMAMTHNTFHNYSSDNNYYKKKKKKGKKSNGNGLKIIRMKPNLLTKAVLVAD